jgi:uncharacterized delta-60 repeat protein
VRRVVFLPLVVLIGALPNAAADGMLDPSFGNGGLVITNFPGGSPTDIAYSLVVLPDGRAVAAGRTGALPGAMAAARYLSSGVLDTTFGGDGLVVVAPNCQLTNDEGGAQDALLQPDGRLVLVGTCPKVAGSEFWLARLNTDGSLDSSFGASGQVFTPFRGGEVVTAGLLQPDGKIVAVGRGEPPGNPKALVAARYNPDGSLDATFGTAGQLTLPLADDFWVEDVALQSDGKLVTGGTYGPLFELDFGLVRLLPNGAPDPSFDGDGLVTSNFGGDEGGTSVIVLGDGRLVLAGSAELGPDVFALVRYLPDGALDTSFGIGGLATADGGGLETAREVVELPNGKLLVAGGTAPHPPRCCDHDFLLTRFHADGALDTSFGTGGFIQSDFGSVLDFCNSVAIAGQDLILTAGRTSTSQGLGDLSDFALARYIATIPVELLGFSVE